MWFSALSCCGSMVVAVACLGLGPLGLCPLPPFVWVLSVFCTPLEESVRGFAVVCLSPRFPYFPLAGGRALVVSGGFPPPVFFYRGGGSLVPPSAFSGLVHALVGIWCGQLGRCRCCGWLRARPRPYGPAGLCRWLGWWPVLSGYVLGLPAGRLRQPFL